MSTYEYVECDSAKSLKKSLLGCLLGLCDVEFGEADLCTNLGRVGVLLYQLVGICHGPGLVDVIVTAFIRCAICCTCICLSTLCVACCIVCFECMLF
jgi:hypothetical protein